MTLPNPDVGLKLEEMQSNRRICGMDSSDQWIVETFYFMEIQMLNEKQNMLIKLIVHLIKLMIQFPTTSANLKRLDFMEANRLIHWDILAKMTELGYSKDCILHYTTNGNVSQTKTS